MVKFNNSYIQPEEELHLGICVWYLSVQTHKLFWSVKKSPTSCLWIINNSSNILFVLYKCLEALVIGSQHSVSHGVNLAQEVVVVLESSQYKLQRSCFLFVRLHFVLNKGACFVVICRILLPLSPSPSQNRIKRQ